MHLIRLGAALATGLIMAACAAPASDDPLSNTQRPDPSGGQPSTLISTDTAVDPTVRRLEREAIALARTEGCSTAEQCKAAPMGNRPCGGPRYYVPYCPLTTDTTALFAKLAEVKRAEDEYNRRMNLASTCEFRMAPDLEVSGGACRARVPQR